MRLLSLDLHDRWEESPEDLADLAAYLRDGVVLRRVRSHTIDLVVPVRGPVVPGSVLTDGDWVWSAGHAHYVRLYAVRLPEDFVRHVRDTGHRVPTVDPVRLRDLSGEIRRLGL